MRQARGAGEVLQNGLVCPNGSRSSTTMPRLRWNSRPGEGDFQRIRSTYFQCPFVLTLHFIKSRPFAGGNLNALWIWQELPKTYADRRDHRNHVQQGSNAKGYMDALTVWKEFGASRLDSRCRGRLATLFMPAASWDYKSWWHRN